MQRNRNFQNYVQVYVRRKVWRPLNPACIKTINTHMPARKKWSQNLWEQPPCPLSWYSPEPELRITLIGWIRFSSHFPLRWKGSGKADGSKHRTRKGGNWKKRNSRGGKKQETNDIESHPILSQFCQRIAPPLINNNFVIISDSWEVHLFFLFLYYCNILQSKCSINITCVN